jgi:hypothetical protein
MSATETGPAVVATAADDSTAGMVTAEPNRRGVPVMRLSSRTHRTPGFAAAQARYGLGF